MSSALTALAASLLFCGSPALARQIVTVDVPARVGASGAVAPVPSTLDDSGAAVLELALL